MVMTKIGSKNETPNGYKILPTNEAMGSSAFVVNN
jgi:hypothetical protein